MDLAAGFIGIRRSIYAARCVVVMPDHLNLPRFLSSPLSYVLPQRSSPLTHPYARQAPSQPAYAI
jgi:hypothetical protein